MADDDYGGKAVAATGASLVTMSAPLRSTQPRGANQTLNRANKAELVDDEMDQRLWADQGDIKGTGRISGSPRIRCTRERRLGRGGARESAVMVMVVACTGGGGAFRRRWTSATKKDRRMRTRMTCRS